MKLAHSELKHYIEFHENRAQIMVIENPQLFYEYIQDIYMQCQEDVEGKFVLSEEDKILSLSKNAYVCVNPFDININSKKVLNKLYSNLKEIAYNENCFMDTNALLGDIEKYCSKLTDESDCDIEYSSHIELTSIFKLVDYKICMDTESLLDKIVNYIDIMQKLLGINLGIFVNLKSYLSQDEFARLYEMMKYRKNKILLIENICPEILLLEEEKYIIDKDGCEIY